MQNLPCACTAVYCGHASGEQCPRLARVTLLIALGALEPHFFSPRDIPLCEHCLANFQRYLPGFAPTLLPWHKVR